MRYFQLNRVDLEQLSVFPSVFDTQINKKHFIEYHSVNKKQEIFLLIQLANL